MAIRKSAVLGIDLAPHQIRIVEIQGRGSAAQVLRAGVAPMPEGAFSGDRIMEPESIGIALRRLLDSSGVVARDAVFGLGSGSVTTQVTAVPHVPANELQAVIEGELEHLKIIRTGEGAFDYARLSGATAAENAANTGESPILVMAAEKNIVNTYRNVADLAGLRLIALEPTLLAMYRVGWMATPDQASVMFLSVDHARSEVAVTEAGSIRLYRRVDVGSGNLFPSLFPAAPGQNTSQARSRTSILGETEIDEVAEASLGSTSQATSMNRTVARALSLEIRRSLEYYRRENAQSTGIDTVVLVSDVPEIEAFRTWLMPELGLNITLARPAALRVLNDTNALNLPALSATQAGEFADIALLPAIGLGLGILPDQPVSVPHFDLSSEQTANAVKDAARRVLTFSLVASTAIIFVGALAALAVGVQANNATRDLEHTQQELATKKQQLQAVITHWQNQQIYLKNLSKKGYPFPQLMDRITSVVAPQAGLTEVALDPAGKLSVTGNAVNYNAIIKTLEGLRTVEYFGIPSLDKWERKQSSEKEPPHLEFKITTQVLDNASISVPAATTGTSATTSGSPGTAVNTPANTPANTVGTPATGGSRPTTGGNP